MKKITCFLFLCTLGYVQAQDTYAIYTENPNIEPGINSLRFVNGQGFSLTEPTSATYEGAENYLFSFNGTSSYFHAIMIPRNSTNTDDMAVDISAYSYYNF